MSRAHNLEGHSSPLRRYVAHHADAIHVEAARALVYRAQSLLHAENHDPLTNGEAGLLTVMRCADCIIDAGAHHGSWTRLALAACPGAEIHCFDVCASARAFLRRSFEGESRTHIAECGLLDREGTVQVKEYAVDSELSSIVDYPHTGAFAWRDEPVRRGDVWMAETGITTVDLLKIDVEGAELAILRGFEAAIGRGAVRVVQFEYGYAAVLSKSLLHDLYGFLSARGYAVGRLHSRGVRFRPYRLVDERFHGPNFVAIRRSDSALVAALERGWPAHPMR